MIGPSDLYRVPLCTSPSQPEELLRYARLEHDAANLEWAVPAVPARRPRIAGVREWLTSAFRLARPMATGASAASPGPGLAAVHFGGEIPRGPVGEHPLAETDHPCALLANSALILPVQPHHPSPDETCACEH